MKRYGPYVDYDKLADGAIALCEQVRDVEPAVTFAELADRCVRDPQRMAQLLMCLAVWVDIDGPASALTARAEAVARGRVRRSA
ncbi:hypothetical protein [Nocardia sp. CY41]|uniref:hypothetical protein n=1 Tax=Nocardia sp. CY41 TaxID=2608686 RepID=UPI001359B071|nr:hypothetical protein [Nocardia sp. CY41]